MNIVCPIASMTASVFHALQNSGTERVTQGPEFVLFNGLPFLFYSGNQLLSVLWMRLFEHRILQSCPGVFYWVKVWGVSWPICPYLNAILLNLAKSLAGCMGCCTIMHEHSNTRLGKICLSLMISVYRGKMLLR